jgi:hypothetical protein
MLQVLEGPDVCSNEGCGQRYNAAYSGWGGACDECTAISDDHFNGLHENPDPNCHDCL